MSISAKLNTFIKDLLNEGLSDSEIIRAVRRQKAWSNMTHRELKKAIEALMDISFASEEEDEEYVPEESEEDSEEESEEAESESEDEEYVPEYESEDSEESEAEESESEKDEECTHARIYFDHTDGTADRLTITPCEGYYNVKLSYDVPASNDASKHSNTFDGDAEAVLEYIKDILDLVSLDKSPFLGLEFAVPFFPNVTLVPKKLKKSQKLILKVLKQYLEHYA